MKLLTTCLLTLTLLALLVVGSHVAKAQTAAGTPATVQVRSKQVARYLASALQLSSKQQRVVERSSRTYLQQLSTLGESPERPGLVAASTAERTLPSPAALQAEQTYEQTLARIFTPGQYNAYSWLTRQPVTSR
ncbi:hypothetical protein ACFPAF_04815 [Hymenobacter endophyticus]|uniref:Uncharacterized protein n=1 Tax=Hymenobacter endophyticus TaxID=3076335 RepID=A0ABU3TEA2_9BACT|nr:hypothetical protein [Hymenobacter endophyticus]MDU0369706.1 hypothetical protein [Hymenobacter endophyticus]